jgi:DNA-binding MarR family transcriptional regulator
MNRKPRIRRLASPCPEEALFVDLVRTADLLARRPAQALRVEDLSPPQYNVLRILRGAPEGLLCGEVAGRMITRDPDVTRILDRLEKRGLIARSRPDCDRRRILARIEADGLALLARLDDPICRIHREQLGTLGTGRMRQLMELLEVCREKLVQEL